MVRQGGARLLLLETRRSLSHRLRVLTNSAAAAVESTNLRSGLFGKSGDAPHLVKLRQSGAVEQQIGLQEQDFLNGGIQVSPPLVSSRRQTASLRLSRCGGGVMHPSHGVAGSPFQVVSVVGGASTHASPNLPMFSPEGSQ